MKGGPLALLGLALLGQAATSPGVALADNALQLKSQASALDKRLAALEKASDARLLTMSIAPLIPIPGENAFADDLPLFTTLGITPTAGVPNQTSIQWFGLVKAALVYDHIGLDLTLADAVTSATVSDSTSESLLATEAQLSVVARTETALGEVGVFTRWIQKSIDLSAEGDSGNGLDRFYGWWWLAPELSIRAGYKNSIGELEHGTYRCACNFVEFVGTDDGIEDSTQFELRYSSQAVEAAVALEYHDSFEDSFGLIQRDGDNFVLAGELKWQAGAFSAELAGYVGRSGAYNSELPAEDFLADNPINVWQLGAGATYAGKGFTVSAGGAVGSAGLESPWIVPPLVAVGEGDFAKANVFLSAALSESVFLELGAGWNKGDGSGVIGVEVPDLGLLGALPGAIKVETLGVAGGLYWTPVRQLTVGTEVSWLNLTQVADTVPSSVTSTTDLEFVTAALVTVFRF